MPGSVHYDEWARASLKSPEIVELDLSFFWKWPRALYIVNNESKPLFWLPRFNKHKKNIEKTPQNDSQNHVNRVPKWRTNEDSQKAVKKEPQIT